MVTAPTYVVSQARPFYGWSNEEGRTSLSRCNVVIRVHGAGVIRNLSFADNSHVRYKHVLPKSES